MDLRDFPKYFVKRLTKCNFLSKVDLKFKISPTLDIDWVWSSLIDLYKPRTETSNKDTILNAEKLYNFF